MEDRLECQISPLIKYRRNQNYEVNILNDKAELYEKIMPVKMLVIVNIDCKHYASTCTYCLTQGICFICSHI